MKPIRSLKHSLITRIRKALASEHLYRLVYAVAGAGALLWFLIRVIPKPQRATYPCQRAAFPIASSFVLWIISLFSLRQFFRKSRSLALESRWGPAFILGAMTIAAAGMSVLTTPSTPLEAAITSSTPEEHQPMGVARGLNPGRVAWIHDPEVTDWDGLESGTLPIDHVDADVCADMLEKGILTLAGADTLSTSWDALFRHFNKSREKGDTGYTNGETIAFKANFTLWNTGHNSRWNSSLYSNGHIDGTTQMFIALCRQLVDHAGVPASAIWVGDTTCYLPEYFRQAVIAEFPGMNFFGSQGHSGYGVEQAESSEIPLIFQDTGTVSEDKIPRQFAEADYIINWAIPKSHGLAGITACAKNHYGSLIRKPPADGYTNLHNCLPGINPGLGKYRGQVELMGHPELGGKTLLYFLDAVFSGMDWSAEPVRWESEPFNGDWPSSIFLSQDPVAIDSVAFDFLRTEWNSLVYDPKFAGGAEDYLHEAAQADAPPSGSFYDPTGLGTGLPSLGVHEHWNNPIDKQYSRNLGTGDGIELVSWEAPTGPDWSGRDWFGGFDSLEGINEGFLHCPDLGWISFHAQDASSVYFCCGEVNGLNWIYTSDSLYPWIWCFDRSEWLWHFSGPWFYASGSSQYIHID